MNFQKSSKVSTNWCRGIWVFHSYHWNFRFKFSRSQLFTVIFEKNLLQFPSKDPLKFLIQNLTLATFSIETSNFPPNNVVENQHFPAFSKKITKVRAIMAFQWFFFVTNINGIFWPTIECQIVYYSEIDCLHEYKSGRKVESFSICLFCSFIFSWNIFFRVALLHASFVYPCSFSANVAISDLKIEDSTVIALNILKFRGKLILLYNFHSLSISKQ